ncbi:MAG: hypothetical protein JWO60_1179, partial [Frankiales bacterium]|nr:hypothetical protein [Frankiales bacterium]
GGGSSSDGPVLAAGASPTAGSVALAPARAGGPSGKAAGSRKNKKKPRGGRR